MQNYSIFFDLPKFKPNEETTFCLNTNFYEKSMTQMLYGNNNEVPFYLREASKYQTERCKELVPYFEVHEILADKKKILSFISQYSHLKFPCSMRLSDINETTNHMIKFHQVLFAHYILGKKENILGTFPSGCCTISSRNIAISMAMHGYPNIVAAYNRKWKHAYTLLPFVMENGFRGAIVGDPTSDQLWISHTGPRNAVFLVEGSRWDYSTEWQFMEEPRKVYKDLYPDTVLDIGGMLELIISEALNENLGTFEFFERAFSNPIDIKQFQ